MSLRGIPPLWRPRTATRTNVRPLFPRATMDEDIVLHPREFETNDYSPHESAAENSTDASRTLSAIITALNAERNYSHENRRKSKETGSITQGKQRTDAAVGPRPKLPMVRAVRHGYESSTTCPLCRTQQGFAVLGRSTTGSRSRRANDVPSAHAISTSARAGQLGWTRTAGISPIGAAGGIPVEFPC